MAAKAGVQAIAADCDYLAPGVETVDVTLDLVALYNPSERVLKIVAELKQHAPMDLDDIERHEH